MRQTLADMAASEKTTFVAVIYGGAALVDGACEAIGGYVVAKWKMVSAIGVVFAFVQGTLIIDPVTTICSNVELKHNVLVSLNDDNFSYLVLCYQNEFLRRFWYVSNMIFFFKLTI